MKKKKLKIILLILELLGGILFTQYGYHWLKIIRYLFLMGFLVILADIDREKMLIPNKILGVMLLTRVILLTGEVYFFPEYWKESLISAGSGFLTGLVIFFLAYLLSRKSIGMGDVKLAAVLGTYLGSALIWWDFAICLALAAVYSVIQLLRKKLTMKDSIPLAPFFSIGTILVLLMGF